MADLLQKYRLLKGLRTGDRACTGPFYVTPDVTRRCNLRCLGCRFHSENARAPYIILTNPINRLNYQGVDAMVALAEHTGFDSISFSPFKEGTEQSPQNKDFV